MSQAELNSILEQLRHFSGGSTIEEMRHDFNTGFSLPPHPQATVEEVDANGVPADWITTPNAIPKRGILYLHGGGFIVGSRQSHRRIASDLAEAAAANVLLIDYRLAPEHPYPAALEDSLSAYQWLINECELDAHHLALAGDSAGGNLVINTLISLRDAQQSLPSAAFIASPYVDLARTGQTLQTKAEVDLMVTLELLETCSTLYVPSSDFQNPCVSPLYADLSNLPPLLIHVGTQEVLLDDALRLVRQVALADGAVELKVWQGMIHCLHLFAPILSEGQQAIAEAGAFLKQHWRSCEMLAELNRTSKTN
jgi:acetyl esterase/lipase